MKRITWTFGVAAIAAACSALGLALSPVGCGQTPVNVPVRTFERAEKVDVVCMRVLRTNADGSLTAIPPEPAQKEQCAPVPPGVDGRSLPFHLFALVTQTARGEVAVVDLTAGGVVDNDRSTPGINFIPVGANPTDLAVAPTGDLVFVAAAEVNKPAIYAVPSTQILGDSQGLAPSDTPPPPRITAWPSCALPQPPVALAVVQHPGKTVDGALDYELVVVLRGHAGVSAKIVTLRARPFAAGAGLDAGAGTEPSVSPGSLAPCPIRAAVELSGDLPSTWPSGATWGDGLPYVDGGVDTSTDLPTAASSCSSPTDAGVPVDGGDAAVADGGDAGAADGGDGGTLPVPAPSDPPSPSAAALDGRTLYVADDARAMIHVLDLSTPGTIALRAPLLATSALDPSRRVSVGALAVSPPTRAFKRYLYAVDRKDGSIMVFDVSAPSDTPRAPLRRPYAAYNPFQPPDRILFSAPVAAVSFVKHDWPLLRNAGGALTTAKTGLLCNPNPKVGETPESFTDDGAYYRENVGIVAKALDPTRLRGVFAFATLTNGQILTLDVDDWDAPCRRPDPMTAPFSLGPLHVPQQATGSGPYEAPQAWTAAQGGASPVSLEAFVPASAPHRPRSAFFLRNDPATGQHLPHLVGVPQLTLQGSSVQARTAPLLSPTYEPGRSELADPTYLRNPSEADPSKRVLELPPQSPKPNEKEFSLPTGASRVPGVRFSFEDPQVHFDQDWSVTYEGTLPGLDNVPAEIRPHDAAYSRLDLRAPSAMFCRRGVEDVAIGAEHARAEAAEATRLSLVPAQAAELRVADYVQIADDLVGDGDPYWRIADAFAGTDLAGDAPQERYRRCADTFGARGDERDGHVLRDLPVLEAYEDHLVLGVYRYINPRAPQPNSRNVAVADDEGTSALLKRVRACFHGSATFKIRTGGRWLALGSAVGYLHHVTRGAGGRCVLSCDPRESLLNARAPDVPVSGGAGAVPPGRSSPLALRNPMFSFIAWSGAAPASDAGTYTTSQRDMVWRFAARGQFTPLSVTLTSGTTSVLPQSMRFIESLGQLAVVDAATQGLVLIDLNTVGFAHAPYY